MFTFCKLCPAYEGLQLKYLSLNQFNQPLEFVFQRVCRKLYRKKKSILDLCRIILCLIGRWESSKVHSRLHELLVLIKKWNLAQSNNGVSETPWKPVKQEKCREKAFGSNVTVSVIGSLSVNARDPRSQTIHVVATWVTLPRGL